MSLQEIAQLLIENIQLAKLFGLATVDQLLEELTLVETDSAGKMHIPFVLRSGNPLLHCARHARSILITKSNLPTIFR